MNIQPKIEPGSSSSINHMILDRDEEEDLETQNLEDKNISDLIEVLRGAYKTEDFDKVEGVLMGRDVELRNQIQQLQHNVEMEKQQLQQELEMEKLARLQAEEDFKLNSKKVKKVQERYEALLKKVKINDSGTGTGTVEVLRKKNIELREMLEKGDREKESYEAQLKKAEIIGLADRDTIGELTKKNVELDCQVKKLKEDGNVVDVLRKKNAELERQVLELNGKRVEEENVVDVLRKKNAELERQVLELNEKRKVVDVLRKKNAELEHDVFELKEKRVEDGKTVDVVKAKNCELESEVCELRKLKEKWVDDSNSVVVLNKMNGELELEVSELKKLKGKWIVDSNTVDELRRKVRVLENDKKGLAGILIKNIELKETISELRSENVKLADEKRKVEDLLESLNTKFRRLNERVARLEEDSKVLMSVNTSGGGNNEGEPPADPMVVASEEKDEEDGRDSEFGNDAVEEVAPVQRNEDAHHSHGVTSSTQVQNHGSKEASLVSEVKGASSDDEDVDQCMSRGVHEKKAISGIALKNDHPTPCSSIAVQQITKFENEVDKVKRKFSLTDSESSTSSSSYDLSYFDDLTIKPVASQAKKKKM